MNLKPTETYMEMVSFSVNLHLTFLKNELQIFLESFNEIFSEKTVDEPLNSFLQTYRAQFITKTRKTSQKY